MRSINHAGLNLIKSFEGLCLQPYRDSGGVWTIGYGHTQGVTGTTASITQLQAENWLKKDLMAAQQSVERLTDVALNDNQYAALVSLVFNVGTAPLKYTLGTKLNAEDYKGAAEEFLRWNHANGIAVVGLTRRRTAERELFLT